MRTPGERPPEGGGSGQPGPAGDAGGPADQGGEAAEAGRILAGRYRVTGRLGRGGMGVVWRAVDDVLGREVAVKELRTFTDAAGGELAELRTRMEREARAAARVRHPGVVSVHDVAQHEGRPVIVMELIEGRSLDDVLRRRGSIEPREAAAVGAKVMDALAAAHRAGVLHRDVKPGNVLLEDGTERVVLTDFGIASLEEPDDGAVTRLTGSGELVGSLDYLAPERARGEPPGAAGDVWALGATLYAAVEGAAPFRRTSTWSTLNAIVVEPLPEPRGAGPLGPVLAELLEKDPGGRAGAERATALLQAVAAGAPLPGGLSETMRLGAAAQGQPAAPPPQHPGGRGESGPPPGNGPAQRPPAASVPGPAWTPVDGAGSASGGDTDARTVRTREERAGGRRRAAVAAAVAAVVLTAAGATYAVMSQDGGEDGGAGKAAGTAGPGPGKDGGRPGEEGPPGDDAKAGSKPETSRGGDGGNGGKGGEGRGGGGAAGGKGAGSGGSGSGSGDPGGGGGRPGTSGGGSTTGGSGGAPGPEPACHPRPGTKKFDCTVWKAADSYNARHEKAGRLNAGTNYFYCQTKLEHRETSGRWTNVWWAKTDDDSGNKGVFVSDVYIKGGADDRPVPGLPVC